MMRGLDGRTFVIAGGGTGIGAATAVRLAEEGASVVVGDLDRDAAAATAAQVTARGGAAVAVRFDLADAGSVQDLMRAAEREFGAIDGLHNVGADMSPEVHGRDVDVLDVDLDVFGRVLDVNLMGYVRTCRAVLPHLLRRGRGSIVNTSSGAALAGEPTRVAYAASKAGVNALTRHVASRWGKDGIRCNAVVPGLVLGPTQVRQDDVALQRRYLGAVPSTRLGEPADVAATTAFLLSDDAAWVNGQTWAVDGGITRGH